MTARPAEAAQPKAPAAAPHGFESVAGKTLTGIDGSRIALTLIEGGIERQISNGATAQKTTFTFLNERLGTVVEDGGPSAGANVTGFFRLTDTGVEVRYADGRAELLSTSDDGVLLSLTGAAGETSCRSWYPDGHVFSEADKKAALAAYASRLGLNGPAASSACGGPAPVAAVKPPRPVKSAPAAFRPQPKVAALQPVAVRQSTVHTIDAPLPAATETPAALPSRAEADKASASQCLKVESDGLNWGFRNGCDYPVQFAYCLAKGAAALTACGPAGQIKGVAGSVAARGFGALSADKSFSEQDAEHNFRWIACAGGAGEVAARLESTEPPSGRCDRGQTASAQ